MPPQQAHVDSVVVNEHIQCDFLCGKLVDGGFNSPFILVVNLNNVQVSSFQLKTRLDSVVGDGESRMSYIREFWVCWEMPSIFVMQR